MVRVAIAALLLAGCSSAPVIDFKASENPKEMVGDEIECLHLADKASMVSWNRMEYYQNCLEGRGYSIINR